MTRVAVTRILNASVLLELGGIAVLTDPCLNPRWPLRFTEPVGTDGAALPPLAAVLGGHRAPDHWQPRSMGSYRHRATTPVYVASAGMARSARRAGFEQAEVLNWGDQRDLGRLRVRCVPGERITRLRTNAWLLSAGDITVFVATEARSLTPVRAIAAAERVDIAVLPVNGATLLGRRLVMEAPTAVEAARTLGASVLVAIHDAQAPIRGLFRTPSGFRHLPRPNDLQVVAEPTGKRVVLLHR